MGDASWVILLFSGFRISAKFFGMMVARDGVEPPPPAFSDSSYSNNFNYLTGHGVAAKCLIIRGSKKHCGSHCGSRWRGRESAAPNKISSDTATTLTAEEVASSLAATLANASRTIQLLPFGQQWWGFVFLLSLTSSRLVIRRR